MSNEELNAIIDECLDEYLDGNELTDEIDTIEEEDEEEDPR